MQSTGRPTQMTSQKLWGEHRGRWSHGNENRKVSDTGLVLKKCLEKALAPHSSPLAWKIPWTEEPGGLHSMGLRRVGLD